MRDDKRWNTPRGSKVIEVGRLPQPDDEWDDGAEDAWNRLDADGLDSSDAMGWPDDPEEE